MPIVSIGNYVHEPVRVTGVTLKGSIREVGGFLLSLVVTNRAMLFGFLPWEPVNILRENRDLPCNPEPLISNCWEAPGGKHLRELGPTRVRERGGGGHCRTRLPHEVGTLAVFAILKHDLKTPVINGADGSRVHLGHWKKTERRHLLVKREPWSLGWFTVLGALPAVNPAVGAAVI